MQCDTALFTKVQCTLICTYIKSAVQSAVVYVPQFNKITEVNAQQRANNHNPTANLTYTQHILGSGVARRVRYLPARTPRRDPTPGYPKRDPPHKKKGSSLQGDPHTDPIPTGSPTDIPRRDTPTSQHGYRDASLPN